MYGRVASDPTVSRTITALAADAPAASKATNAARAAARARAWSLAGPDAPDHHIDAGAPLVIDLDANLVTSHSDKEHARPTFKRGYGFHPLTAFVDHGAAGTGEPLAVLPRPGNAGSNTAADHITVVRDALRQLPSHRPGTRPGRRVPIRTDGAGCTHAVLKWMTTQRLPYSIRFTPPDATPDLLQRVPDAVWAPAYDAHDGAWVAELTDLLDLSAWPKGMRVIVRRERPHPGAQLRLEDVDGCRITDRQGHRPGQPAAARLRPNQIWCAIVALALDLTAWMQTLALTGHDAHRWEPKRLRLRLFTVPATLARTSRRVLLHLATRAPWADVVLAAVHRLRVLAVPG